MIKKILIGVGVGILILIVAVVLIVGFRLDDIVKAGIETFGPKITQTTLTVRSVNIGILTGAASVNGLVLGNPTGFQSPTAVSVEKTSVSVAPASVLSDKIVIKTVEVRSPDITFEGNPFGANNLKKIMDNVNAFAGSAGTTPTANAPAQAGANKPAKKLEVDDFLITGAKVHAQINTGILNKEINLTLADIHLTGLGQGAAGITPAELTQKVLGQITTSTIEALGKAVTDLGKNLGNLGGTAGKAAADSVDKVKKGLGGLFGK